jgi:NADH:ubiquinone oxidoreductase subunit 6 (subunit J)
MGGFLGLPLAVLLILAGIVVIIAASIVHWLLVILGIVIIAVGVYFLVTGGAGPL